jgi:DNA-directed RNA polymerase sigma subunit (sigma70/sigma32)
MSHAGAVPGCALDIAKSSPEGLPLEEVGKLLGVTRERVRQIEERALEKMRRAARKLKLAA